MTGQCQSCERNVCNGVPTSINLLDALISQDLSELVGQPVAHLLPTSINRNTIYGAVLSSEVDHLKDVRCICLPLDNLAILGLASFSDEDCLSGQDVMDVAETKLLQSH